MILRNFKFYFLCEKILRKCDWNEKTKIFLLQYILILNTFLQLFVRFLIRVNNTTEKVERRKFSGFKIYDSCCAIFFLLISHTFYSTLLSTVGFFGFYDTREIFRKLWKFSLEKLSLQLQNCPFENEIMYRFSYYQAERKLKKTKKFLLLLLVGFIPSIHRMNY